MAVWCSIRRTCHSTFANSICLGVLQSGEKKAGIAHNNASTSCTGGGNIKAIRIVEELHSPGRVFRRRSSHGIYDDGGLLSLKFVNRSDLAADQALLKPVYLIVVRRDD